MFLDIVIPTFQRADLLVCTLESILRAACPPELQINIIVVDNNSTDHTQESIGRFVDKFGGRLVSVIERKQGLSYARNAGIAIARGDIIAMLDDDEEVCSGWLEALYHTFLEPTIDYIGGPVRPKWASAPPDWLPLDHYPGVLGFIEQESELIDYCPESNVMLCGGNCAFRRRVFEIVGLYRTDLGRTATGLLGGEDNDYYERLLEAKLKGRHVPEFAIYHYIPTERMTRSYYRRWVFGRAISLSRLASTYQDKQLLGIPRWKFREALRRLGVWIFGGFHNKDSVITELELVEIAGLLYGKYCRR